MSGHYVCGRPGWLGLHERDIARSDVIDEFSRKEKASLRLVVQAIYDYQDTIWIAGRNAPSRGEVFRVRLSFSRLKAKAAWRVQKIPLSPDDFMWSN